MRQLRKVRWKTSRAPLARAFLHCSFFLLHGYAILSADLVLGLVFSSLSWEVLRRPIVQVLIYRIMEDRRGLFSRQPSYGTNASNDFPNGALSNVRSGHFETGLGARASTHSHPGYDHDVELPLDAFGRKFLTTAGFNLLTCTDKELLAQIPQERQQQASQGLARISLPPRYGPYGDSDPQHLTVRGMFLTLSST